jgi:hypothetical protein
LIASAWQQAAYQSRAKAENIRVLRNRDFRILEERCYEGYVTIYRQMSKYRQ